MVLKEFILTKVADLKPAILLKTTCCTSIIQTFCLIFRNTLLKENISVVASTIPYRSFFSNTTKWLSLTIKKYIRLLIKKIARKYKKNYNKMKLRLKLKFVNKKLCLTTCYGFFYKLYKFTCRTLRQLYSSIFVFPS